MDESDSDDDEPLNGTAHDGADGENKYPYEGLYKNRTEKYEIQNMVEFEREQLLADRATEIEKLRQSRILRQFVKTQDADERKKKRTADVAELGPDGGGAAHKALRQRTTTATTTATTHITTSTRAEAGKPGEASSAIETLRRAKAEKVDRIRRRAEDGERRDGRSPGQMSRSRSRSRSLRRRRLRSSSPFDSSDSEMESRPKSIFPADLRDVERLRLGRNRFSEVCYTPGFAEAMKGCYTRINVGPNPETGVDVYRMAVIKGMFFVVYCLYSVVCPAAPTDRQQKSRLARPTRWRARAACL